jgi:hypothetical protein
MGNIEWTQVIIAFIIGVLLSATAKGVASSLKNKVSGG